MRWINPFFFGDSLGDLRAAQDAGVAFVAVVNERDNFPDLQIVKINDFIAIETIQSSIHRALHQFNQNGGHDEHRVYN